MKDIESFSKNIAEFFNTKEIDGEIGSKILYNIVSEKKNYYKDILEIRIIPLNTFPSYSNKKEYFKSIFRLIDNSFCSNSISVNLNNKYIYDDFIRYKKHNKSIFEISYKPSLIRYSKKMSHLKKSNQLFNNAKLKNTHLIENKSILNHLTDSSLSGPKYKEIKKIIFKYNNLDNINYSKDKIKQNLINLESALYDLIKIDVFTDKNNSSNSHISSSINKSLLYIKSAIFSLSNNSNDYKKAILIDKYYNDVVDYFTANVNTEKIVAENINENIIKIYSDYNQSYYLTEFNKSFTNEGFGEYDYKLIESCFGDLDVSNYNDIYNYIKIIIGLFFICLFIIRIKR